ncbi:MAG: iron-sulfur cluster insertion protein ErpA [Chloroflexota bacterium]|nr:MAG: iron-sulfur cluster insertion protein ErpA [Chloroflexota bacterium]
MISLTDQALSQLKGLMTEQGLNDLGLRVFVSPGGCSGFQYGMRFEDTAMEGDIVEKSEGIQLFVDEFSAQYVDGAEIDFVDELMGGGFTVHNPNAITSCGCGQSFTTASGAGAARACGH